MPLLTFPSKHFKVTEEIFMNEDTVIWQESPDTTLPTTTSTYTIAAPPGLQAGGSDCSLLAQSGTVELGSTSHLPSNHLPVLLQRKTIILNC